MKHRLELHLVISRLRVQQQALVTQLRETRGAADVLEEKRQVDRAIACLEICERFQIHPDSKITMIPDSMDWMGEFAVVDVGEGLERIHWEPLNINDRPLTLSSGDLVVEVRHCENTSTARNTSDDAHSLS